MGYCTVSDLKAHIPRFVANYPGNLSDDTLQCFIDERAAIIYAKLLNRGVDTGINASRLGLMGLTAEQEEAARDWLKGLNKGGAVADVLDALTANVTLQAGEVSQAGSEDRHFWKRLDEIGQGKWDAVFGNPSRIQGQAGADTTAGEVSADRGETAVFSKAASY